MAGFLAGVYDGAVADGAVGGAEDDGDGFAVVRVPLVNALALGVEVERFWPAGGCFSG